MQLKKLSNLASFGPDEPSFRRFSKIQTMGALFTEDIVILLDSIDTDTRTLRGRDELKQYAMAAKTIGNGLKAEFFDVNIDLGPSREAAVVDLTAKLKFGGDPDFIPMELKLNMKKIHGEWLINRVESVSPLKP